MAVNKVILIGNVGKDPEVRYFDNGGAVANFTLATTERGYMAANGTQVPERTEWHNIVLWRSLAEIAEKYVKKGTKLYIEGKIRTRSYDDSSGNKRYVTEIWGDTMELLSARPEGPGVSHTPDNASSPVENNNRQAASFQQPASSVPDESGNDDLPF